MVPPQAWQQIETGVLQRVRLLDRVMADVYGPCLLYTSDAADERSSVDLGGRRIIKKKNRDSVTVSRQMELLKQ